MLQNIPYGKFIALHLIDKDKNTFEYWIGFVADTTYLRFEQQNNTIRVLNGGYLQKAYYENTKKVSYWKKSLDSLDEVERNNYLRKCVDTIKIFYNHFKKYEFCYNYLYLRKDFFEKTRQIDTLKKLMEEGRERYPKYFFINLFLEEYANLETLIIGRKISDIILPNEKGKKIHIQKLSSKYIFIDFWATWCAPCIKEQRFLKENFAKFTKKDISIVAISIDSDKQKWKNFLQKAAYPWINLLDTKNYQQKFSIKEIPRNILLNEKREIIGIDLNLEEIDKLIP
jgi:thiol-disulfide isomerase/thioredoxin